MKKYKHIKTGLEAVQMTANYKMGECEVPGCIIENSNEWKEVEDNIIKKDYEILSFIYSDKSIATSDNHCFVDLVNKFKGRTPKFWCESTESGKIHSVKRLSDGEIFTIGDKVEGYKNTGIKAFRLYDHGLRIITDANGDGCVAKELAWKIEELKKAKIPLFTTEDDIKIYPGDEYYHVVSNWIPQRENAIELGRDEYIKYNKKRFFSKKAIEDYIIQNKPCLSIKEVQELLVCRPSYYRVVSDYTKLEELVKSRI